MSQDPTKTPNPRKVQLNAPSPDGSIGSLGSVASRASAAGTQSRLANAKSKLEMTDTELAELQGEIDAANKTVEDLKAAMEGELEEFAAEANLNLEAEVELIEDDEKDIEERRAKCLGKFETDYANGVEAAKQKFQETLDGLLATKNKKTEEKNLYYDGKLKILGEEKSSLKQATAADIDNKKAELQAGVDEAKAKAEAVKAERAPTMSNLLKIRGAQQKALLKIQGDVDGIEKEEEEKKSSKDDEDDDDDEKQENKKGPDDDDKAGERKPDDDDGDDGSDPKSGGSSRSASGSNSGGSKEGSGKGSNSSSGDQSPEKKDSASNGGSAKSCAGGAVLKKKVPAFGDKNKFETVLDEIETNDDKDDSTGNGVQFHSTTTTSIESDKEAAPLGTIKTPAKTVVHVLGASSDKSSQEDNMSPSSSGRSPVGSSTSPTPTASRTASPDAASASAGGSLSGSPASYDGGFPMGGDDSSSDEEISSDDEEFSTPSSGKEASSGGKMKASIDCGKMDIEDDDAILSDEDEEEDEEVPSAGLPDIFGGVVALFANTSNKSNAQQKLMKYAKTAPLSYITKLVHNIVPLTSGGEAPTKISQITINTNGFRKCAKLLKSSNLPQNKFFEEEVTRQLSQKDRKKVKLYKFFCARPLWNGDRRRVLGNPYLLVTGVESHTLQFYQCRFGLWMGLECDVDLERVMAANSDPEIDIDGDGFGDDEDTISVLSA